MQIREITKLNENVLGAALGAAASGAASALGVSGDVSGAFGSIGGGPAASGYGDARRKAAAATAKTSIEAMAKREMQSWNAAVADLVKQKQVQKASQLDTSSKMALRRDLFNRLHKVFMQGRLGNNYIQELPTSVDKLRQPEAKDLVNRLNLATQAIMNFNKEAATPEEQLKQWQNLSQTAYDAMSLSQFYPATTRARTGVVTGPMPKILGPNTDGSYNIGDSTQGKLGSGPVDTLITQKIQAELKANPSRPPEIKSTNDGSITIGSQRLDPRKPEEAKAIQRIMSLVTASGPAAPPAPEPAAAPAAAPAATPQPAQNKPAGAPAAGAGFNAANVMRMPGMTRTPAVAESKHTTQSSKR
jgi:hypothetical protein